MNGYKSEAPLPRSPVWATLLTVGLSALWKWWKKRKARHE